jgi:BirA family transcriptional regulator, biotin operon repressor / biotin---[acetyl-CoA-carboxylase] ligase
MPDARELVFIRGLLPVGKEIGLSALQGEIGIDPGQLEIYMRRLEECGLVFGLTKETVRIKSEPDSLIPELIMAGLKTDRIGREVLVFKETSSTNDRVRQAGMGAAGEGLVIFAESQTEGRGTHGKKWISLTGAGLWFSILLRSSIQPDERPRLLQMAAVACAEAIEECLGQPIQIKPPNDLYLEGGKLAGFLLETSSAWNFQVLGIGLNVRSAPAIDGYRTAAIDQFARNRISRNALAASILNHFEDWYCGRSISEISSAFESHL